MDRHDSHPVSHPGPRRLRPAGPGTVPDGTIGFFREVNAANQSVFCSVAPGIWTDCVASMPLSPGHRVKAIQLRVFGQPFAAGEGAAFIDDVAPLD